MSLADIPIWEWCWMIFAAISAFVYVLVLVAIIRARRGKTNNILKAPFFTLIFIQGVHEILELCTTTGFNRLRKYRIIKYAIMEDNKLVEWQWHWYNYLKGILYFGHVEMALNRLSAVVFTKYKRYDELWNTKNIIYINISGYIVTACLRIFIYSIFFSDMIVTTSISPRADLLSFNQTGDAPVFENSVDIVLSLSTAFICMLCYSATALLQGKRAFVNVKTKKRESILLKIGLATFLILLPTTIRSGLELWAFLADQKAFHQFIVSWNTLPPEAMCIAQPWLLILSVRILRESMFFKQTNVSNALFMTTSNT